MAQRPAAFYASVPYFQIQPRGVIKDIAGKNEDGVGDLGLALAYWLYDDKLNGDYLSAVFILEAPTGQYDSDKLLNPGKNRYSFVFNLGGMTRLTDKVAWMMVAGTQWFEDNNDYRLTHQNHEQKNLYTLQNTLMYEPNPKLTLAASHHIHRGGKSSLGGLTQYENVNTDRWQLFIKMKIDSSSLLLHYGQDYSVENGFKQDRLLILRFQHLF
jgi:hypothetical protein